MIGASVSVALSSDTAGAPLARGDREAPGHLFLLGSPIQTARLAIRLGANPLFRLATRDCGQLLASPERMAAIGIPDVPTTAIVGTRGILNRRGSFGAETNDGVVSLSEVSAGWLEDRVFVPVVHTLLPSSRRVAAVILQRLRPSEVRAPRWLYSPGCAGQSPSLDRTDCSGPSRR